MIIHINIVPTNLLEFTWLVMGFLFARSFGKRLDHHIQHTDWYRGLKPFYKWVVKSLLNFLHHFWIGLLLMCYFPNIPEVYWFGVGLFIDDLPDLPRRFRKYLSLENLI